MRDILLCCYVLPDGTLVNVIRLSVGGIQARCWQWPALDTGDVGPSHTFW